jgi:hypothetical protein
MKTLLTILTTFSVLLSFGQDWEIVSYSTSGSTFDNFCSYKGNIFASKRVNGLLRAFRYSENTWVAESALNQLFDQTETYSVIWMESLNDTALLVVIGGAEGFESSTASKYYSNRYYLFNDLDEEPILIHENKLTKIVYAGYKYSGYGWNNKDLYFPKNVSDNPYEDSLFVMLKYQGGNFDTLFSFQDFELRFMSGMTNGLFLSVQMEEEQTNSTAKLHVYNDIDLTLTQLSASEVDLSRLAGVPYLNGFLVPTFDYLFGSTDPFRRLAYGQAHLPVQYVADANFDQTYNCINTKEMFISTLSAQPMERMNSAFNI